MINSFCLCTNKTDNKFKEIIRYKNETVFKNYEGTVIGKCVNCGLLKTFPSFKNKFFNTRQSKIDMYDSNEDKFIKLFMPIAARIKKYKQNGIVLDVGCSSGLLPALLKKQKYKVFGIEPNIIAYKRARKKLGKRVFNGTLGDYIKNNKNQFDCIIYNHVIEHIKQVNAEIEMVKKILKKDGIIVIGVPNTNNIIFTLRQKRWESLMPNEHIWHFSSNYIIDLFGKHGFKTVNRSFCDHDRKDYPFLKQKYFQILSFVNKLFNTGEAVLLIMKIG